MEQKKRQLLRRSFYERSPTVVARELIGKLLVRRLSSRDILEGIIVETEAYGGREDPASHAFRGKTLRNDVMFGQAGHAYVYFTYGFHYCLNFVTGKEGVASAVLIRAVEPTKGMDLMSKFRKTMVANNIASGPGKLCQAFAIDKRFNGCDVTEQGSPILVLDAGIANPRISISKRIGIRVATERRWRFFADSNQHVSRRSK